MRRNPELALLVSQMPEIREQRHFAIDKVTAAHLAVDLLSRAKDKQIDPIKELEIEEQAMEMMDEAVYHFHKYIRNKLKAYEDLLQQEHKEFGASIQKGNKLIKDTLDLAKERGIK